MSQIFISFLILFICSGITACSSSGAKHSLNEQSSTKVLLTEKTAKSVGLLTATVQKHHLKITQTLPGKIEPDVGKEVNISSRVAGRVDQLLVAPGQSVKKGDVLAIITSREVSDLEAQAVVLIAQLETAKAQETRQRQVYVEQVHLPKALIDARTAVKDANLKRNLMESQLHREQILYQEKISAYKNLFAAKTAFEQTEIDLEHAKANLTREEALFKNKSVLRGPYQLAEAERIKAEKQLQSLHSQLKFLGVDAQTLNANLKEGALPGVLKIIAPIGGILSFFEVAPGELIEADKPIFRITDPSTVLVSAEVPESEIPLVRLGGNIHVTISGMTKSFPAVISIVANHVNPITRTLTVRARLQNPEGFFKPGMFADVKLDERSNIVLAIPRSGVQELNGNKIVFVRTSDGFEKRIITTGLEEADFVEVLSGLTDGEEVATQGSLMLKTELITNQNE